MSPLAGSAPDTSLLVPGFSFEDYGLSFDSVFGDSISDIGYVSEGAGVPYLPGVPAPAGLSLSQPGH